MISSKCHYALRAMLELAKREGSGPATIVEIAQSRKIPARFLEAILRQLKEANYTESVRGKKGGYVLAKPARKITVGDIIRLMEGPLFKAEVTAAESRHDVFRDIWVQAESALADVYGSVNFHQLVEREKERDRKFVVDYSI